MSLSICKKFIAFLSSFLFLITVAASLQADEQANALDEIAGMLLDGKNSDALTLAKQSIGNSSGTVQEDSLRKVIEMLECLGKVDDFVLDNLKTRVGEKIPASVRGRRTPVEIVSVDSAEAISVNCHDERGTYNIKISLVDISSIDKMHLLGDMPEKGKALYAALIAWKARQGKPFLRFAEITGVLAPHLKDIARKRVASERQEAAQRREAERRERGLARVDDTENREWEEFEEGRIIRVACDVQGAIPKAAFFAGKEAAGAGGNPALETQTKGYHYDLYIPPGYNNNKNHWYPVMFIASPGGNAGMGPMAARLKKDGYVVVMLVESRNSSNQWLFNFLAAHDDVVKRVRIAPGAKFGTGMSGGARVSSAWPGFRPGFCGVILQAAATIWGMPDDWVGEEYMKRYTPAVAVAMTVGTRDFNFYEIYRLRKFLNSDCLAMIDIFDGGHTWCPFEVFNRVMNWQEKVNFLDPPRSVAAFKAPYARIEHEPIHPVAYKWFFLLTNQRAANADDPYLKYYHLSRLPTIAANGGIQNDPEVIDVLQQNVEKFRELQKHPEVTAKLPVTKKFEEFMELHKEFVAIVADGLNEEKIWYNDFKNNYPHQEIYAGRKTSATGRRALAAGRKIVEEYPGTPQADFLKGFLKGLEFELK